jgi:hypothetical protein
MRHRVVTGTGLLILTHVGGEPAHLAVELRRSALAECREAQNGLLSDVDLVGTASGTKHDHLGW